jgi:hypothetical protein
VQASGLADAVGEVTKDAARSSVEEEKRKSMVLMPAAYRGYFKWSTGIRFKN